MPNKNERVRRRSFKKWSCVPMIAQAFLALVSGPGAADPGAAHSRRLIYLNLNFEKQPGRAEQLRRDVLFELARNQVLDHITMIEVLNHHGGRSREVVQFDRIKLMGSSLRDVDQVAGINLLIGPDETPLSYSSSRIVGLFLEPEHWSGSISQMYKNFAEEKMVEVRPEHPKSFHSRIDLAEMINEVFPNFARDGAIVESLRKKSAGFVTFVEYLQQTRFASNAPSRFLGLSYAGGLLHYLQSFQNIQGPRRSALAAGFYEDFGVQPGELGHVEKVMTRLLQDDVPVYFFVPPDVLNRKLYKVTRDEILFLSEQESLKKVQFVFGAYEAIPQRNFYEAFRNPQKVLEEYECELALLKATSRR